MVLNVPVTFVPGSVRCSSALYLFFCLLQEIDGVALLLMKRADVLKGLELKLGPALKINRYIQSLQAATQLASQRPAAT